MTVTDELLANNAEYAASFSGPLPLPPAKGVASELIVAPAPASVSVMRMLRTVLPAPPYTASPAARRVSLVVRFSSTLPASPPAARSVAENNAAGSARAYRR